MPTLKNSKTAHNLIHAFAGESQEETVTLISHQLLKKKDMYKSLISLKKLQTKKKNMLKD